MTGEDRAVGDGLHALRRRLTPALPLAQRRSRSTYDRADRGTEIHGSPSSNRTLDDVVGDCAVYDRTGRATGRLRVSDVPDLTKADHEFVWIGLQQPTAEEFEAIAAEFHLPALAVEDAVTAHQRPKLDVYGDIVFVVLKPVRYVDSHEVVEVSEIAFFLGPTFVITVRHGSSDVLARVRAEIDAAGSKLVSHGPTAVLYRAADLVVDEYERVSESIAIDIEEIEGQVFSGDRHDHAQRIYTLKREVLEFRRCVVPLAVPLERLSHDGIPSIDAEAADYFRDVHDHVLRAADAIEGHDRLLSDVLSADLAQVSVRQSEISVRQNEDMRKISAWAAIALVPTAIAGIYGMNFEHMPELEWTYGYPAVLLVILAACTGLYVAFRRNGWL